MIEAVKSAPSGPCPSLCAVEIVNDRLDVRAVERGPGERSTIGAADQGKGALELRLVDRPREAAARRDDQCRPYRLHREGRTSRARNEEPGGAVSQEGVSPGRHGHRYQSRPAAPRAEISTRSVDRVDVKPEHPRPHRSRREEEGSPKTRDRQWLARITGTSGGQPDAGGPLPRSAWRGPIGRQSMPPACL